jgi:hypothetical protein
MSKTHAELLRELWKLVEADLAPGEDPPTGAVTYTGLFGKEGGCYVRQQSARGIMPRIELARTPCPNPQTSPDLVTSPLADMLDLAHEHGHFLSDKNLDRTEAYDFAVKFMEAGRLQGRILTPENEEAVREEEERAWDYARKTLATLGFAGEEAFDMRRARALRTYEDEFVIRARLAKRDQRARASSRVMRHGRARWSKF